MHKKEITDYQKRHFGFLAVNNIFLCILKNTNQHNICESFVIKARTNKKYEENFVYSFFYFKTQKCPFLGVNHFFLLNFSQF